MANNESKGFYKLNWAQRIGFGSGDLAQNLIFQTVACYLMLYLTTVLKINPAFVSGLILSVRLIDCFWSPIVGRYIDNRNPKLGKYRSYLLYGGIPLTIAACLLMLPQAAAWSMTMKIIYATVSYTLLSMIYSVVNIPYGSIMASMTRDNDEVLILTSTRMVCANIGQIVVQAGFPIGLAMVAHTAIDRLFSWPSVQSLHLSSFLPCLYSRDGSERKAFIICFFPSASSDSPPCM